MTSCGGNGEVLMPGHLGCGISLAFIDRSASSYSFEGVDSVNGSLLKRPLFYQPVIVVSMKTEIELNHFGNLILIHLDTNTLQDPLVKATLALAQDTNRNTQLRKTTQAANRNRKTKKKKHTLFTSIYINIHINIHINIYNCKFLSSYPCSYRQKKHHNHP